MMLWSLLALMTAAAVLAVLWPLLRQRSAAAAGLGGADLAIYRDQLEEIERDRALGTIGASEAEAARVEVSRRLIAAAEAAGIAEPTQQQKRQGKRIGAAAEAKRSQDDALPRRRRLAAAVTLVALPVGAVGLYLAIGSPDLPGQPVAAQMAAAASGNETVEAAIARVEAHLEQHPQDGHGWEVIAPVYMRLGRYDDAVKARTNALRLLGVSAQREADLGEALVAAANGIVTAEAKAVFDDAIRLDPLDVSARFYQGLAAEQDGDRAEAARLWRKLLADAPEGAQWVSIVREALARLDSPGAADARNAAANVPASAAATPSGQDQMIRGMVERLASRLRQDGSDVDGWVRLVRSYGVLGEPERARAAIAEARAALGNDADKLRRLDEGLENLKAEAFAPPGTPESGARELASPARPPAGHDDQAVSNVVERLAARLRQNASDVGGWLLLVRSHRTLGEVEQARAAVAEARAALANDPEKLRGFEQGLETLAAGSTAAVAPEPDKREPAPSAAPGQEQMIRGMVERLAARLNQDGSDVDGWVRLVRSYQVLGESDRARTAAADARRALANDADKLRRLDEGVKSLGVEESAQ
jgi:cytochrome c-type biogenesis protein CcmH